MHRGTLGHTGRASGTPRQRNNPQARTAPERFTYERATGAGFMATLIMGVQPQVLPRFIGFATYQLDSNLRNSTTVGIVGGGGIGATMFTAHQRFDYDFVLAIIIVITDTAGITPPLPRMILFNVIVIIVIITIIQLKMEQPQTHRLPVIREGGRSGVS